MIYLFVGIGTLLAVFLFFRLLTLVSRKTNRVTARDYADFVERYIEGVDGPYEWDEFMTIPVGDGRLDAVRRRLYDLGGGGPPFSQKTLADLREILRELQSMQGKGGG